MSVRLKARTTIKPRSGLGFVEKTSRSPIERDGPPSAKGIASRRDREGVDGGFAGDYVWSVTDDGLFGVMLVPLGPGHIAGAFFNGPQPRGGQPP
jgi:hypothetical protein